MTVPNPDAGTIWLTIAALGLGTFALRLSFILLYARLDGLSPKIERALRFLPVAVLSALVLPAVVTLGGPVEAARPVAALAAGVVAWRTRSITATIAVGMVVLWTVEFVA